MSGFLSQTPYGNAPTYYQQAPDAGAIGATARAAASGLDQVAGQFAAVWGRQQQAQAANDAAAIAAGKAMELDDLVRGFDADPEPATVPARAREKLAEWQAAALADAPPGVSQYLQRTLGSMVPQAYARIGGAATRRTNEALRGQLDTTLGTEAQALAGAADEPGLLAAVERSKAAIAGNVRAGVIGEAVAGPLFSRAIRQAVTIKAAADPIAAQALLDRFKGEMDAADVAALTTSLRAPVEGKQDEGAAERALAIPEAVRARAQLVVDGLVARGLPLHVAQGLAANAVQESGADPHTRPGDGGRSHHLMQWNADRLAALRARYGAAPTLDQQLDFVAEELRTTEGRAGAALLAATTPEEAARLASTLYLRPRDTATEERRRAGYARLLAGGSGREMALAAVRGEAEAEGLPLHRVLRREALVAQSFAHAEAAQGQQRAALRQEVADLASAYQGGQTAAEIPEERIRATLPPDQAQRTVDELQLARAAGQAVQAVAAASPEEEGAMRTRLMGDPGATYMAGERQAAVAAYDRAIAAKRRALEADPHAYAVAADPQVRALAEAEAPVRELAAASLEAQRRMGVPEARQRVLSNATVEQMAATLRITGPETADLAPRLAALAEQFGPLWGRAYGELVQHGKVAWPVQALAGMTAPQQAEGRAGLQAALRFVAERGPEALDKLIPADERKAIPLETEAALGDFAEATRHHPGGAGLRATMREAVDLLTRWHASRGMGAADAAQRAYQDVIGARWDTAGDDGSGIFGRTPTLLVPKGQAGAIETALDRVRGAIKLADLAPLADPLTPGATEAQLREATLRAAQRGIWINNADASGAVLKGRTPGGQIVDILDSEGRPIEVRFDRLQQTADAVAAPAGLPQAAADGTRAAPAPQRPASFGEILSRNSGDPLAAASNWLVDNFIGPTGRPAPGIAQDSPMPPSTVPAPERPREQLPVFRPLLRWAEDTRRRYPYRRPGQPLEGDR